MIELMVEHFHFLYDIIRMTDPGKGDVDDFCRRFGSICIFGRNAGDFKHGGETGE
jgi:hypothetical protein